MEDLHRKLRRVVNKNYPYLPKEDPAHVDPKFIACSRKRIPGYSGTLIRVDDRQKLPREYQTCNNAEIYLGLDLETTFKLISSENLSENIKDGGETVWSSVINVQPKREIGLGAHLRMGELRPGGNIWLEIFQEAFQTDFRTMICIPAGSVSTESVFWQDIFNLSLEKRKPFFAAELYDPEKGKDGWNGGKNSVSVLYLPA